MAVGPVGRRGPCALSTVAEAGGLWVCPGEKRGDPPAAAETLGVPALRRAEVWPRWQVGWSGERERGALALRLVSVSPRTGATTQVNQGPLRVTVPVCVYHFEGR